MQRNGIKVHGMNAQHAKLIKHVGHYSSLRGDYTMLYLVCHKTLSV